MYPHYSPMTNNHVPNLLPVVYPALIELGYDMQALRTIVDSYIHDNAIKDLNSVYFVANDFETHYLRKLEYFEEQAKSHAIKDVIIDYMKDKKRSMSSAKFIGLVRLATAINENDGERMVHALAFYDCVSQELKISGVDIDITDARKGFIALMQKRRHFRGLSLAKRESEKIRIIIQNQENLLNIVGYQSLEQLESVMLETFTEWYLMTEDDYVLHVILGFHALYRLRDYFADYEQWLLEYWLQAQVFSMMIKRSLLWKKVVLLEWTELCARLTQVSDLKKLLLFYAAQDLSNYFKLDNLRRVCQTVVAKVEIDH